MYVHNNTFNVTSESDGVQLAAGAETNIAIDRTYITHQLAPYSKSPCIQPNNKADYINAGPVNKYIDATYDIFDYYSQETCILPFLQYFLDNFRKYIIIAFLYISGVFLLSNAFKSATTLQTEHLSVIPSILNL